METTKRILRTIEDDLAQARGIVASRCLRRIGDARKQLQTLEGDLLNDSSFKVLADICKEGFKALDAKLDHAMTIRSKPVEERCDQPHKDADGRPPLKTFPPICPPFDDEYRSDRRRYDPASQEYIHWACVIESQQFSLDVEEVNTWLRSSGTWCLNGSSKEGAFWVTRAKCRLGGSTAQYEKQIASGSKAAGNSMKSGFCGGSRALDDDGFECCRAELRIVYNPGQYLKKVEIRLGTMSSSRQRAHTHGPLDSGGVITPGLARLDSSLVIMNMITKGALTTALSPSNVLADVIGKIWNDPSNRSNYYDKLVKLRSTPEGVKLVQDHVSKVRQQHNVVTLDSLDDLRIRLQNAFESQTGDPRLHSPIALGLSYQLDASHNIEEFVMTFSTLCMLKRAVKACQAKLVISTDCSFKKTQSGYPILTIGTITATGKFRLIAVSLVCREATYSYKHAFQHLSRALSKEFAFDFYPSYLMGDSNPAIDAALHALSDQGRVCTRLICFSHMMKAVRNHILYKAGANKNEWIFVRNMLRIISGARSEAQFSYFIRCFKDRIRSHFVNKPRVINYIENSPYFTHSSPISNWYWGPRGGDSMSTLWLPRTNNATESFNNVMRTQFFYNKLMPAQLALKVLSGPELIACSMVGDELEFTQDYTANTRQMKQIWKHVSKKESTVNVRLIAAKYNFMAPSIDFPGSTYSLNGNEEIDLVVSQGIYDPFTTDSHPGSIVYLPPIEMFCYSPDKGGPVCLCKEYIRRNACWHIALLGKKVLNIDCTTKKIRVAKPKKAYGSTRPRIPPTVRGSFSLRRMDSRVLIDSAQGNPAASELTSESSMNFDQECPIRIANENLTSTTRQPRKKKVPSHVSSEQSPTNESTPEGSQHLNQTSHIRAKKGRSAPATRGPSSSSNLFREAAPHEVMADMVMTRSRKRKAILDL